MKKRYIFIVITIILAIVIQVLSVNITPALKKIADKEINRFCQMVINNTPFPVTLDHQELIKINRNGDEIATINFNTSYASSIGAKMVNKLDELFVAIEEGTYKVTFSTEGRELKIHTTDYVEEGKEVGLTFFPEDIHVMEKMGF